MTKTIHRIRVNPFMLPIWKFSSLSVGQVCFKIWFDRYNFQANIGGPDQMQHIEMSGLGLLCLVMYQK